jgi:hypothetical protein
VSDYPPEFLELLRSVTGRRARIVIDHILQHGSITTEQLKIIYGYNHPPRAIKDVRDHGIPIEKFSVKDNDGKTIAAYRFGDLSAVRAGILSGRKVFSRAFKTVLIEMQGAKCAICATRYEARYLQIDHRVPYEIGGDPVSASQSEFMLLCGSCNRAKSWTCEHCPNWQEKSPDVCRACYWANPVNYQHVATEPIRRLDIHWRGIEVEDYERLATHAASENITVADYIKTVLAKLLDAPNSQ